MPSAIVTLPDGRRAKITAKDRATVEAKARELTTTQQPLTPMGNPIPAGMPNLADVTGRGPVDIGALGSPDSTFASNFGHAALTHFLSNAIGVPNLIATAGGRMLLGLPLVDRPAPLPAGVDPRINAPLLEMPKVGERVLPLPTGEQVVAGAETVAKLPGALISGQPLDVANRFKGQLAADQRAAEEHPIAAGLGTTAADAATILTGRLGAAKAFRTPPGSMVPFKAQKELRGWRNMLNQVVRKKISPNLGRGLQRAAEAGIEGATLAALDEGDPVKTAMISAGAQGLGSAALTGLAAARRNPYKTLLGLAVGYQMWKTLGPGKRDFFKAQDAAFNEYLGLYALGAVAALSGMKRFPRIRDTLGGEMPKLAEAITALPRGSVESAIKALTKADESGDEDTKAVIQRFAENPDAFGPGAKVRIGRAADKGEDALLKEIDLLMKNKAFRDKLDEAE